MLVCEKCYQQNEDDMVRCVNCGATLPFSAVSTIALPEDLLDEVVPGIQWGIILAGDYYELEVAGECIPFQLMNGQAVILGRNNGAPSGFELETMPMDPNIVPPTAELNSLPDDSIRLDLHPYGATQAGVSRHHVLLKRENYLVIVRDLGSTNGTWLNGIRLDPKRRRLLRNGDEIRLGILTVKVRFLHKKDLKKRKRETF